MQADSSSTTTNSETHPSVQTVSLVGSWDNFSKHYAMERDSRRDRGQWRGCHTFKDIICDGDQPGPSRRNGGLKMGQPYYFYYELDGLHETHDPKRPSTSACPFLPGQTVNIMTLPAEKSDRKRSASLSSVNGDDFMTKQPNDKFLAPRPTPVIPAIPEFLGPRHRLQTAPSLKHKTSDRSLPTTPTPTPSWWSPKKLFARKHASSSSQASIESSAEEEQRSGSASSTSESTNARFMSPESLRRFLMDEAPTSPDLESGDRPELSIPDDIVEEDDDDFVVASTTSEFGPRTILSPPPPPASRKGSSAHVLRRPSENGSAVTLTASPPYRRSSASARYPLPSATFYQQPSQQEPEDVDVPTSRFSFSSDEGSVFDDADSTPPTDNEMPSFYHSDAEDDDIDTDCLSSPRQPMGHESAEQSPARAFRGYRLPQTSIDGQDKSMSSSREGAGASVAVVSSPPLLALPVIDDLASELKSAGLFF